MFKFFWLTKKDEDIEETFEIEEYEDETGSSITEEINLEEENEGQLCVDILETRYEYIILAPVAGIDIDDIDVNYKDGVLVISGYRALPEIYSKDINVKISECFWWKFSRNLILPENLDYEDIRATIENNLLVVTIAKLRFSNNSIIIEKV